MLLLQQFIKLDDSLCDPVSAYVGTRIRLFQTFEHVSQLFLEFALGLSKLLPQRVKSVLDLILSPSLEHLDDLAPSVSKLPLRLQKQQVLLQ